MSWLDDYNPHTTIEVDNLWDAQLDIATVSLSLCGLTMWTALSYTPVLVHSEESQL